MSVSERTERVLNRAARGEADIGEIEDCISATRADLDRNLSAIEQRLSTDALIHDAVDYLRSTPGEFFSNFGNTVKRNPVPIALLGISLGWLMWGGQRNAVDSDVRRTYGGTAWSADDEVYKDRELYDVDTDAAVAGDDVSAVDRVRDAMRSTKSSVTDRASRVASSAADMKQRVGESVDRVGDKVSEADEHAREVFQRARERVARARRIIAQQPKRMKAGAQDMAQHHPFILGAIAFATGAAIAASMKRSRFEDELMGGYRDQALATAGEHARTGLEHGMTSARSEAGSDLRADDEKNEAPDGEREPTLGLEHESLERTTPAQPESREAQDRFH